MIRICPKPELWYKVFQTLEKYARTHKCAPSDPPRALVLSGWTFATDLEKKERWEEMLAWATGNNCIYLVVDIADKDFYEVEELITYPVNPNGDPLYRSWDYEAKTLPAETELKAYLNYLSNNWESIVGKDLSGVTQPYMFTGAKARRLLVYCKESYHPPWGEWFQLSGDEAERRTFTRFRAAINMVISPHEVDHIDFVPS
ncbi:MAG: hypothetical protein HN590_12220 [Calditrichaeota bacterium]|jgi:hypothetical protein|nr:hypothetical protein [Calditrichota bacterium]